MSPARVRLSLTCQESSSQRRARPAIEGKRPAIEGKEFGFPQEPAGDRVPPRHGGEGPGARPCGKNDLINTTLAQCLCSHSRNRLGASAPMWRAIMRLVCTLFLIAAIAGVSEASVQLISITVAPPVLPVYEQPPIPGPGYIWTPGYWAWAMTITTGCPGRGGAAGGGRALDPTLLGLARWHLRLERGLLGGPHIGLYGGINYGFGYTWATPAAFGAAACSATTGR
jgi:WXXGXW repeat (2 copies)